MKHILTIISVLLITICYSQNITTNKLLKQTEQSLKKINTVVYKIEKSSNYFGSNETDYSNAICSLYIEPKDRLCSYFIIHSKDSKKNYSNVKYDGSLAQSLYYNIDSLDYKKKIRTQDIELKGHSYVNGTHYILNDYFKKDNIFKQYRSLIANIFIKEITVEESVYKDTPVYILTVYGKDKPRPNRINSSIDKYYIRKNDFLPIAHSFYGEFEGMKENTFTEIEYLNINPNLSLDFFKVDPTIKEVKPRAFYEESQKYNL